MPVNVIEPNVPSALKSLTGGNAPVLGSVGGVCESVPAVPPGSLDVPAVPPGSALPPPAPAAVLPAADGPALFPPLIALGMPPVPGCAPEPLVAIGPVVIPGPGLAAVPADPPGWLLALSSSSPCDVQPISPTNAHAVNPRITSLNMGES
jgi:hypothetical protein